MKKKLAKLAARIQALEDAIAKIGKKPPGRKKRKKSKPAKAKKPAAAAGKKKAKKKPKNLAVSPVAAKSNAAPKAKATARDPSSAAV